jgi:hypothetical protein
MKLLAGINKWGVAVLGVAILLLVVNLVAQYRDMQPRKSPAHLAPVTTASKQAGKASPSAADDLAKYDPTVHFDALKALDSRPLPDVDGSPFGISVQAPAIVAQAPGRAPIAQPAPVAAPAAPPPLPLKAMGYNELPGGKSEAMVTFNDDLVVVHEGDSIGTKFKVVKIDPTKVVVQDGETHQTLELPIPQ